MAPTTTLPAVEVVELPLQPTATIRETVSQEAIPETLARIFDDVLAVVGEQDQSPSGPPFARYHRFGESTDVEAGYPVSEPIDSHGAVRSSTLPEGPALYAVHTGSYDTLGHTYEALDEWRADHSRTANGGPWECYLTDPMTTPDPAGWRTEIYLPLRPD